MSVDDIGIMKHVDMVRSGKVTGYQDLGQDVAFEDFGGGSTGVPASHVMTIMLCGVNDRFKIPLAYFPITDKFSGRGIFCLNYGVHYQINHIK